MVNVIICSPHRTFRTIKSNRMIWARSVADWTGREMHKVCWWENWRKCSVEQ